MNGNHIRFDTAAALACGAGQAEVSCAEVTG